MKTTDMREICSFSQTGKNVLGYYQSSKITTQNGSGDENVTMIQSPSAEGMISEYDDRKVSTILAPWTDFYGRFQCGRLEVAL